MVVEVADKSDVESNKAFDDDDDDDTTEDDDDNENSVDIVVKGCAEKASQYLATIPSDDDWKVLRQTYARISGERATRNKGMQIPHQVEIDDPLGRGRGVVATENVPKGERIWKDRQVATFEKEEDLVEYLQLLSSHHRLQCDILLWAYPYHGTAQVDLDVGSFINHADLPTDINVDQDGYATRDIAPGEPILMNYTEFIEYDTVPWFDRIRNVAWKQEEADDSNTLVYQPTPAYIDIGATPLPPPPTMTLTTTLKGPQSGTISSSTLPSSPSSSQLSSWRVSDWKPFIGLISHEMRLVDALLLSPLLFLGLFMLQSRLIR